MPNLSSDIAPGVIILGDNLLYDVVSLHGLEILPPDIDGKRILSLKLPTLPITAAGIEVASRDFYLCYALQYSILFIAEAEVASSVASHYRPQYGANDNYDTFTKTQRIVWIYTPDSSRARAPEVAKLLADFLPATSHPVATLTPAKS